MLAFGSLESRAWEFNSLLTSKQLIYTALVGLPQVEPGDDLAQLVLDAIKETELDLQNGDVLIFAQKVISKSEDRCVYLPSVHPSSDAVLLGERTQKDPRLVELILSESNEILRTRPGLIVVEHRLGFVCANAGIDHSNVFRPDGKPEDWVLLLPKDPDLSASRLQQGIRNATGAEIGVLIIDSHGRAWRNGIVGVTIGAAGFPTLVDMRGALDLYGNPLLVTQIGLADEVAAGASVLMGQANEGRPVIHLRGLPYNLREGSLKELIRKKDEDLFR